MRISSRLAAVSSAVLLTGSLAACSTTSLDQPGYGSYPSTSSYPSSGSYPAGGQMAAVETGRITNIEFVQGSGQPSGNSGAVGTIIGGVAGAALGNQVGGGSGRAAATVLGAIGGAVAGNRIARNRDGSTYTGPAYRVTVQTDQGQWRTYEVGSPGDLRVGDRVRVDNGVIYRS